MPGGSSEAGESGRCAAHRETWEETGLDLRPGELLARFETGFHLYRCEFHGASGDIRVTRPLEVRRAFYRNPEQFETLNWRFPEQVELLEGLIEDARAGSVPE
jgi:8-oxo-dGTP diphosphatase